MVRIRPFVVSGIAAILSGVWFDSAARAADASTAESAQVASAARAVVATEGAVCEEDAAEVVEQATLSAENPASAAALVEQALAAGLANDQTRRTELLNLAIAADPDYAPARWHSGQVRFEGQWRTLDAVRDRVAANPRRDEYLQQFHEAPDTPAAHTELADWCMRHGLENEERFHWIKVLFADRSHQRARSRLGLRPFQDGLYSESEIAELDSKRIAAEASMKKYRPIFADHCRRVTRSESSDRESALAALGAVDELEQLPALEVAIQRAARGAKPADSVALYLALMKSYGNVPNYEATVALLNYSLFAVVPEVRIAAARALKGRPVTDYVPRLMTMLTAPIEGSISTHVANDGTVSYQEMLYQAGPLADQSSNRGTRFIAATRDTRREPTPAERARAAQAMQLRAARMAQESRQRVAIANAQAAAGNIRVREVLANVFGDDLGPDPAVYWQAWTDYNELLFDEHPVYEYNDFSLQLEPLTHSCFMAGTPVWTQEGLRPIETIVVGDLVLAQHPVTGEVAYRPVLEKTVGTPTPTLAVELADETIVATRGHRFWVEDQGWEMAKSLTPEMTLHSIASPLLVKSVEPSEELECHNMVVEGFHTYFVGNSQVLVHDKTCPRPTTSKTPGQEGAASAAKRGASLQASAR